jgi:pimeloyl-ACP methyl ester carboxylesterase
VNPAAVVAHGAASTAEFVRRAFEPALAAAGYRLVTWDRRGHDDAEAQLAALVDETRARIVGGVSYGALVATRFVAARGAAGLDGMLLALPPPPGELAPSPSTVIRQIGEHGIAAALDEVCRGAPPWIGAELRSAWPTYGADELVAELCLAAGLTEPSAADFAHCDVATGVVSLADDPFHPAAVAAAWTAGLPRAALEPLALTAPAGDVSVIGAAAVRAWRAAGALSGSR